MFNIPKQNCWVELISDEIIPVLYPGYFNYTTGKEIEVYYLLHGRWIKKASYVHLMYYKMDEAKPCPKHGYHPKNSFCPYESLQEYGISYRDLEKKLPPCFLSELRKFEQMDGYVIKLYGKTLRFLENTLCHVYLGEGTVTPSNKERWEKIKNTISILPDTVLPSDASFIRWRTGPTGIMTSSLGAYGFPDRNYMKTNGWDPIDGDCEWVRIRRTIHNSSPYKSGGGCYILVPALS